MEIRKPVSKCMSILKTLAAICDKMVNATRVFNTFITGWLFDKTFGVMTFKKV